MGFIFDGLKHFFARLSLGWQGASVALLLLTLLVWGNFSYGYFLSQPHWLIGTLALIAGFIAAGLIGLAVVLGIGILSAIPRYFVWSLVVTLYLIWIGFDDLDGDVSLEFAGRILPSIAILGAGLGYFIRGGWRYKNAFATGVALLAIPVGGLYLIYTAVWIFGDGEDLVPPADASSTRFVAPLDMSDPALSGDYVVKTLSYGSGIDKWRPQYADKVSIVTSAVDGSAFVDQWNGWAGWWRTYYWGFAPRNLPRNAMVWYPDGKGPFPLVLIVHGNTMMERHSEEGYEYLGVLLASRGYIVASVDENFLNSSWHSLWQGISGNDARAWLLLEHLRLWRNWNQDSGGPFFQQVDLDNVAIIGHSRGGEAASLAKTFNDLPYYPDDCTISFDYHFGIKSIIGIAPVDGQFEPAGSPNRLRNVNYLVIHGSYDGDVRAFQGASQYQRITFDADTKWLKTSAYIYGANHGQFNTIWGSYDMWPLEAWLLNIKPLMPAESQRRVAQVYVSAFLDATLKGKDGYRALLQDHRVGHRWLPNTVYITNYQDGTYRYIADFDEDIDPSRPTIAGGKQNGENLSVWREHQVCLKYGCMDTRAVFLGWDAAIGGSTPSYTIEMPKGAVPITLDSSLVFSMADARTEDDVEDMIDLTIEVVDAEGQSARLPLSHWSGLQASLPACIWKSQFLDCDLSSDNVYQSFVFAMRDFVKVNPSFNPIDLTTVRFIFDRTPSWEIILDDVGVRPY